MTAPTCLQPYTQEDWALYIREELAQLDHPLRRDESRILWELRNLFRAYRYAQPTQDWSAAK